MNSIERYSVQERADQIGLGYTRPVNGGLAAELSDAGLELDDIHFHTKLIARNNRFANFACSIVARNTSFFSRSGILLSTRTPAT